MAKLRSQLLIYLKGVAMGGADVVPGVSGGTMAFITGIYSQLLDSINSIDKEALTYLFQFKIRDFWVKVNGKFLLPLFLGIVTSLLSLSKLIQHLLENEPISLWSFFFGLIIISSVLVLREIKKWKFQILISILIGIAIAFWITIATPSETTEALWFVFISGCIAICAMILPGISGAFLLLILGKYEFVLSTVNRLVSGVLTGSFDTIGNDLLVVLVFILGCLVGILSFSRAISWLLKNYHDLAIALLSGFMIGSLNKVWPWKIATGFRINSEGKQVITTTENIFPSEYLSLTNEQPLIFQALLFIALGILIVVIIEKIAHMKNNSSK